LVASLVYDRLHFVLARGTRGRIQPNDAVLRDRDHCQIAFLQTSPERSAGSEGGDLHPGVVILRPEGNQLLFELFLCTLVMKLDGE
jgi:hypothetical protein